MQEKKPFTEIGDNDSMPQDDQDFKRPALLNFWQIDHFFKCPVVGMCLSLSEQKQLLKKAGLPGKKKSPYEIHEMLVVSSESENRLSRRADNLLNRKFGKEAAFLLELDHGQFMEHCKAAFKSGDCLGVVWAAAISPELPLECKRELFGEMHMTMHWNGHQSIKLKRKLAGQQKELIAMRQSIKDAARSRRLLQRGNEHLRQKQTDLKAKITAAVREKTELEEALAGVDNRYSIDALEQENRMLKEGLDALCERLAENQRETDSLKEKNTGMSAELERQRESNRFITKEAQEIIKEVFTLNRCEESCPSFDLCKKRILIVGGITRMESLYRQLIEGSGGIFEYHDGYMKKGVKGLECRLRRADVVLCPVSCNSHAACSLVKNLGKKHNTPVHLMANFSLNAISHMIGGNGGEKSRQN